VQAPASSSRLMRMQQPKLSTSITNGKATTIIRHREFLADVNGSTAFNALTFAINPGLVGTFPWLASIANNWDSYLFRKLDFSYETACSSITPGSVMMSIDFDAADPAPTSKLQLMTYDNAVRSASWQEARYDATVQNLHKFGIQRFTRSKALAANLDIKTYDVGNLFLATSGQATNAPIGELYVDYVVELFTPQINVETLIDEGGQGKVVATTGLNVTTAIFGTAAIVTGDAGLSATGSVLTFNSLGEYLLTLSMTGTTLSVNAAPVASAGMTVSAISQGSNAADTLLTDSMLVSVTAVGATLSYVGKTTGLTLTNTTVRVGTYPASLG